MSKGKINPVDIMVDGDNLSVTSAAKIAAYIVGIGIVAGTTLVIGMDRLMKKIFVGEEWPREEWSNDDWAGEDLEG